jgi:hypothetical protein
MLTQSTSFSGVEYLTDKKIAIDATVTISEGSTKFTFKENSIKVNDFG